MNIVLIGYRGTGKSAVGRRLANRLERPLLNFDQLIIVRAGKSIPEIVAESGWEYFRDLESEITRECSQRDGCIFDTGGGCILRKENVEALRRNGRIFWLHASVPVIADRIRGDDQRPSLTGDKNFIAEIEQVLSERMDKYQAAADVTIDTDGLTVDEIAELIIEKFQTEDI